MYINMDEKSMMNLDEIITEFKQIFDDDQIPKKFKSKYIKYHINYYKIN